jgi:hypothetical protein
LRQGAIVTLAKKIDEAEYLIGTGRCRV